MSGRGRKKVPVPPPRHFLMEQPFAATYLGHNFLIVWFTFTWAEKIETLGN
jgi:hypothetical protein